MSDVFRASKVWNVAISAEIAAEAFRRWGNRFNGASVTYGHHVDELIGLPAVTSQLAWFPYEVGNRAMQRFRKQGYISRSGRVWKLTPAGIDLVAKLNAEHACRPRQEKEFQHEDR